MVKNLPATWETWVRSLGWEDHLEKGTATNSVLWPGEFLGQRSLAGYSPWGHKELDMTQQLSLLLHTICKIYIHMFFLKNLYVHVNSLHRFERTEYTVLATVINFGAANGMSNVCNVYLFSKESLFIYNE